MWTSKVVLGAIIAAATGLTVADARTSPPAIPALPAHTGACVWNEVSQAGRDRMLASYKVRHDKRIDEFRPRDAELGPAINRCLGATEPSDDVQSLAVSLMELYAIRQGSARSLLDSYGVSGPRLDAAWAGLTPQARIALHRAALNIANGDGTAVDGVDGQARLFATGIGFSPDSTDPDAQDHILNYMLGRASDWEEAEGR